MGKHITIILEDNRIKKCEKQAKPSQILIGNDVYQRLHPSSQRGFVQIVWEKDEWRHNSRITGKMYFGIQGNDFI